MLASAMAKPPNKSSAPGSSPTANAMWGGRFASGPAAVMAAINTSLDVDKRLAAEDVQGSLAHAEMLGAQGIVPKTAATSITDGLKKIQSELAAGTFPFRPEMEDIHMNVEARLAELIGDAAGRLHTARSRNDQVATDFRLWVRRQIDELDISLQDLQRTLIEKAEAEAATIMPGFTHLQTAQPVTFGHHLLAYVEMIGRDRSRFKDARHRLNESPLGAAALAGTSFPIDRHRTAIALGFNQPMANSLDAVADRDFALEFLAAASICAMHLSRFAEEIVLWCSAQFQFIRLSDAFTTGSSIMPQKRNPDAAELSRAKIGRILGAFTGLLMVMKGLPLTYSKDMQEDKAPTFEAVDALNLIIAAMTGMVRDMSPNREAMRAATAGGFPTATDLADWLVREKGIPFREAHHITGRIVRLAETNKCLLADLDLAALQQIDARIDNGVYDVLSLDASVNSRISYGGTAPTNVRAAAVKARERFL